MKSIGIDIGTTTISIILVNYPGLDVVQRYTIDNDTFLPAEHSWERIQNVRSILSKVLTALEEILNFHQDVASIGLTGQMHGIVYIDKNGSAVSPLYTWQDGRGNLSEFDNNSSLCEILSRDFCTKTATGYGMVTHLYNIKKGLVPAEARSFCTIADYIGMELTGRTVPLLHISQAAGMGLYDHKTHDFMRNILADQGVNPSFLPQITTGLAPLGSFRGIPVCVSIGDNQASFLGSVRHGADSVLVNVGTGAQISVLSDMYFDGDGIEARPFTEDSCLLVGSALCGGSAYAALELFFREYVVAAGGMDVPQYEIMEQLMEQQDKQSSWNVRTTFLGTRENPGQTGSISGIRMDNFHPAALARGVLCGMAQELYDYYRIMESRAGLTRTRLVASGNGVRRNRILQSILQECFGMTLEVEQNEEEAAFGAAVASLAATGVLSLRQWMEL